MVSYRRSSLQKMYKNAIWQKRKHAQEKYFTESDRLKEIIHEMEGMAWSFVQTKDHVAKNKK